ncbi:helix-turn-helix domain-containing protein [Streptomyces sp. NPDC056944]|uniref:helix-turn-helix domain-containing protein n=1 Tax=Streptomyces sp. NPDC056944 TaxID=3345972 RepID=UPI00362AD7FF
MLLASRGRSNAGIATETRLHVDTVRRWRGRFAVGRMPALADRQRSGRPPTFTALQIAEVKPLACQLPAESRTRGRHPGHHRDDLRPHTPGR